jgi:hypothetical protein
VTGTQEDSGETERSDAIVKRLKEKWRIEESERNRERPSDAMRMAAVVIVLISCLAPGTIFLIIFDVGNDNPWNFLHLLTISAVLLAAIASGLRLAAHDQNKALDWLGKTLGFWAAILGVLTALLFGLRDINGLGEVRPLPPETVPAVSCQVKGSGDSASPGKTDFSSQLIDNVTHFSECFTAGDK